VDARAFVWGDTFDEAFALTLERGRERTGLVPFDKVSDIPDDSVDRSVYGVLALGGNVREWTATRFEEDEERFFEVKGGSAATPKRFAYCAYSSDTPVVPTDIGFRYVMPVRPALDGVPEPGPGR
jgi:formylglycine-generating enzyme required for sulfatase activity